MSRRHTGRADAPVDPASRTVAKRPPNVSYGELMTQFKQEHDATIVAVADDVLGNGLSLNAPASKNVGPDQVICYIAERRIAQME